MAKKRIVIFYHHGEGNQEIAQTDYGAFFSLIEKKVAKYDNVAIEPIFCPNVEVLIKSIERLTTQEKGIKELYFHFIGHGSESGIPYNDWQLTNQDFATLLSHTKIISCFFASCRSSELVEMANAVKIPVVCGTLHDNDIENTFAIEFEILFYEQLLESKSFHDAFEYALASVRNTKQIDLTSTPILRSAGSFGKLKESELNQMQIVFSSEEAQSAVLLPADFIDELDIALDKELVCILHWFDNPTHHDGFRRAFMHGFEGRLEFINIPAANEDANPLRLMSELSEMVAGGFCRLVLHLSKQEELPTEIVNHIAEDSVDPRYKNYKVIICHKNGLDLEEVIANAQVFKKVKQLPIFKFEELSTEVIVFDDFINELEEHEIGFSERRNIALDFDAPPIKEEILENENPEDFVKIFLANNTNEFFVNFLTNWAKSAEEIENPVFVVDNVGSPNLDFLQQLHEQIKTVKNHDKGIRRQLMKLLDEGCVIIFRNKVESTEEWIKLINSFLAKIHEAVDFMVEDDEIPTTPSYIYFLHNENVTLSFDKANIYFKSLSKPSDVDSDVIKDWSSPYLKRTRNSKAIVKAMTEITENMDPQRYIDCCPSVAIMEICNGFKLPLNQVVNV